MRMIPPSPSSSTPPAQINVINRQGRLANAVGDFHGNSDHCNNYPTETSQGLFEYDLLCAGDKRGVRSGDRDDQ